MWVIDLAKPFWDALAIIGIIVIIILVIAIVRDEYKFRAEMKKIKRNGEDSI